MLVVHQTVLEKLPGHPDTAVRVKDYLDRLLEVSGYCRGNQEDHQRVIICSGRGSVREAPSTVRTIGLSPILYGALARQSKWALWRSLIAARSNQTSDKI